MKVLILHQHFRLPQDGGAIRSYYLAKALAERGVLPVVITAHNELKYRKESIEGIEVHYLPIPYDNRFGFYKRVYAFFKFIAKSVRMAASHRDASVCYTISTPLTTGLAAGIIRHRYRVPYIFEVGDLWPDAPIQMGFIRNPLLKHLLYRMEKAIYRGASSIVALSPSILEAIREKASGKVLHLLPNMSDTAFFLPGKKRPELEDEFAVRGKFVVSYIGAIGVANGLQYFLDCAAASQHAGLPIHFLMCGEGAMMEDLRAYAVKLSLDNFTFVPFRNRDGVAEIMNITDANFISYQRVEVLETGSPNKYFDGLAAGKLTIINFEGWIRKEIEKEACGIFLDPGYPEDFVRKIRPFLENERLLEAYQHSGRRLAERKYSRNMLAARFVDILDDHVKVPAINV